VATVSFKSFINKLVYWKRA